MNEKFLSFSEGGFTLPQEEVLELKLENKKLSIGIPKEVLLQEKRIGLVPDAVNLLTNNNHNVIVQSGVGDFINFSDQEYSECGASIVQTAKEVYQSDIILKVSPRYLLIVQINNLQLSSAIFFTGKLEISFKLIVE